MTDISKVSNPDNIVELNLQEITILCKDGNKFFMVIGSDNDDTGQAFIDLVANKRSVVNFKGLRIWPNNALMALSNIKNTPSLEAKLADILKGKPCMMPSNYDFERRCGIRMNGDRYLRMTDAAPYRYFKYQISLLGNPKHVLVFKIDEWFYKESDFYSKFVAPHVKKPVA